MTQAQAPRNSVVASGAGDIEIFQFGQTGELIICAAGNGRPAAQFTPFAQELASHGYRVVTFNYRGIGGSHAPIEGLTLHDFSQDIWSIADSLECETVHLLGKAFGNRVMRTASSDQPERVSTITLVAAGGEVQPTEETQTKFRRYFDTSLSRDEWTQLHAEINYAPVNAHLASAAADLGTYPLVAAGQVASIRATAPDDWLVGGTAPMLVMVGLDDCVAPPENGLRLAERRPSTWLVGLPDCGHSMLDEQPEAIMRSLTTFLRHAHL